jgi:fatty acid desaturase
VSPRPDMKRFRRIDDRLAILFIALDYLSIVVIAVFAIAAHSLLVTLVAIVLIAGRQVAFLNLVHAAAHCSLFSTKRRNDHADLLVGYPIFDAVAPYRSYHLDHHRDVALKRPDRFDYLQDQLPAPDASALRRTWVLIIKPLLGFAGIDYLQVTLETYRDDASLARKALAFWLTLLGIFSYAGWLSYLLVYWFLPLVWLYPVFYFWAEISDHHAVLDESRNQRGLFYCLFLKGHEMYHAVHHRYPDIPFYRINVANRYLASIGETLPEESRGLVDFVRILYRSAPRGPELHAPPM